MKTKRLAAALCAALFVLVMHGCVYSSVQRPLDTDFDKTTLGSKVGRSYAHSLLWLVAWGDAGTEAAAKEGGITTITHADVQVKLVLFGLYMRVSTVLYGD